MKGSIQKKGSVIMPSYPLAENESGIKEAQQRRVLNECLMKSSMSLTMALK